MSETMTADNPLLRQLQQSVRNWEQLGHPALLERFVLRNGKPYTPRRRIGRRRKAKHCFENSTSFVMGKRGGTYVEGLTMTPGLPIPILHAWVTMDGADAMDPTLESEGRFYVGVPFDAQIVVREMLRNEVYGLLDPGHGLNTDLMFEIDPELRDICERIMKRRIA